MRDTLVRLTLLLSVVLGGCDLEAGKPFSWKSTINTEFDIPSGSRFAFGSYQFGSDFQIGSGSFTGKMQTVVPRAQVGTVPQRIGLSFQQYDSAMLNMKASYDLIAPLKMRPSGAGYKLTYKFNDGTFPALSFAPFDVVQMNIQPIGGTIGTGWRVVGAYTLTPR